MFLCVLQDLYVGCKLTVFKRMFELLDADEYTLSYMDNNKHIFIMADADAILESLRGQVRNRAEGGGGSGGDSQTQQAPCGSLTQQA